MTRSKLVQGVGINDVDYSVSKHRYWYENGVRKGKRVWVCSYYTRWTRMLERCYSITLHKRNPTYKGCTVSEEWKTFSNFRKWVVTKENEYKRLGLSFCFNELHLDKDFILEGNKHYSKETCVFIHNKVNGFIVDSGASRGECLIGVYWNKQANKFQADCGDPFTNKQDSYCYLGLFTTELEAHLKWKSRKHQLAQLLSDSEYVWHGFIKQKLRTMYSPSTDWALL